MITSRAVLETADQTGFRPDVVEKVLRLWGILNRLDAHPSCRGMWVLKGGTSLNLFHLDVPRLSIDIDLNFVGAEDVEGMRRARPEFERGLTACCERENCSVAASRNDCRLLKPPAAALDARAISRELEPLLRRTAEGEAPDCDDLAAWIGETLRPVQGSLLSWSKGERRFLDRLLDEGEIAPEHLHPDRAVQDRVHMQPMLRWKAQNVREHRGGA